QCTDLSDGTFDQFSPQIRQIVAALPSLTAPQADSGPKPRTELEDIKRILQTNAHIRTIDRIAVGELSDVYRGEYGGRSLAIKAFHNSLLPERYRKDLLAQVALGSNLNHPAFLRISHALFHEHLCFVVSDHVEGATTVAHKIKQEGSTAFSINE